MYIYIYAGTKIKTPDIYIFSPKIWLDFIFKTMEIDEISCVTGNKKTVGKRIYLSILSCCIISSLTFYLAPFIHPYRSPPSLLYVLVCTSSLI